MASKVGDREKVAKEINQIKKNIRQKHHALTENIFNTEREVEKSLKPITDPLKQLVKDKKVKKQNKIIPEDIEMDDIQERLKNKRPLEDESMSHRALFKREAVQATGDDSAEMHADESPEAVYESPSSVKELLSTPKGRKEAEYYIDNLFKGLLVKRYMHMFFDDSNHNIDHVFGPNYGDNDVLMLGNYPIHFDNDDIIINNVKYEGTPGLYELIFMRQPDKYIYTEEDLQTYRQILKITSTHIHPSTGRIKSSKSLKYNKIIKPIVWASSSPSTSSPHRARQYWRGDDTGGHGLMKITDTKPNYIYWNNVNELCDRLQLLVASQNAGHTGHDNEILSIIEELYEAGIIKESAAEFKLLFRK